MAFIEPMHRNKPNFTHLLTIVDTPIGTDFLLSAVATAYDLSLSILSRLFLTAFGDDRFYTDM